MLFGLSLLVCAILLVLLGACRHSARTAAAGLRRELAAVRASLARVTDHAPIGIFRASATGELLSVNARLAFLSGYGSPDEMTGAVRDSGDLFNCSMDEWKKVLERIFADGQVHSRILKCRKRDGSFLWLSLDAVLDETGSANADPCFEGFVIDVSESVTDKDRFRILAETDMLTSVKNRRCFTDILDAEIVRQKRYPRDLSVLLLDIDHFKHVNDTWGHDSGDAILVSLARTVEGCIRVTDTFARLGGEEFVLLLPETGREGAMTIAERIRLAVERDLRVRIDADTVAITASIGVATSEGNLSGEELIRRADSAMYEAKKMGRNRVSLFILPA